MKVISLRSGSEANCFLVWTEETAILVDAGVSPRYISKKLELLNINQTTLKGLLISHEHIDHSRYAFSIASQFNIPLYVNEKTLHVLLSKLNFKEYKNNIRVVFFKPNKMFKLAEFYIYPVSVKHDAVDPVGFGIKSGEFKISYFVDIAYIDEHIWKYISKSHLVIIDSNYDTKMLLSNKEYPVRLKERIINSAHLSNEDVANMILNHPQKYTTEFWLAHLSKDNNSPEVVTKTIKLILAKAKVKFPVNFKILPQRKLGPLWSSEKYSQLMLPLETKISSKNFFSYFYKTLNEEQKKKFDSTVEKVYNMKNFKFEPVKTQHTNEYAWRVNSSTDPSEIYVVARDVPIVGITGVKILDKIWSCECADFIFRCQKLGIPCKHILKLISEIYSTSIETK